MACILSWSSTALGLKSKSRDPDDGVRLQHRLSSQVSDQQFIGIFGLLCPYRMTPLKWILSASSMQVKSHKHSTSKLYPHLLAWPDTQRRTQTLRKHQINQGTLMLFLSGQSQFAPKLVSCYTITCWHCTVSIWTCIKQVANRLRHGWLSREGAADQRWCVQGRSLKDSLLHPQEHVRRWAMGLARDRWRIGSPQHHYASLSVMKNTM